MTLVMTLLVRDEQDIIGANVEYHLAQGVDFIIATDNRSTDTTPEILKDYEAKGVLRYLYEGRDDYNQQDWVTKMARLAYSEHGAEWVINCDADEFWWPLEDDLKTTLGGLPATTNLVQAHRHNFVPVELSAQPFWSQMTYREMVSRNALGAVLSPKVAHRGSDAVVVVQGNHEIEGIENPAEATGVIEILHFPIRSYGQIENKIAKGGRAYQRNQDFPETIGETWRQLYAELDRFGNLHHYFDDNFHDEQRLARRLDRGEIVKDERLATYLMESPNSWDKRYPAGKSATK